MVSTLQGGDPRGASPETSRASPMLHPTQKLEPSGNPERFMLKGFVGTNKGVAVFDNPVVSFNTLDHVGLAGKAPKIALAGFKASGVLLTRLPPPVQAVSPQSRQAAS
jgi:hypothetical protein